jgi:hypothetical protein
MTGTYFFLDVDWGPHLSTIKIQREKRVLCCIWDTFHSSISRSLPVVDIPGIKVYGLTQEVNEAERKCGESYQEAPLFLKFY